MILEFRNLVVGVLRYVFSACLLVFSATCTVYAIWNQKTGFWKEVPGRGFFLFLSWDAFIHSLDVFFLLHVSFSLSLCCSVSLSLYLALCIFLCLSVSLFLFFSLCLSLSLSVSVSVSLCTATRVQSLRAVQ